MKSNKFTNDLASASIHTNGFADAAGGVFGQVSPESFADRYKRDRERRLIAGYRQSIVGGGLNKPSRDLRVPTRKEPLNDSSVNKKIPRSFQEPSKRGYNPYA